MQNNIETQQAERHFDPLPIKKKMVCEQRKLEEQLKVLGKDKKTFRSHLKNGQNQKYKRRAL